MYSFDIWGIVTAAGQGNSQAFFRYIQERLQEDKYADIPQAVRRNFAEIRMNAEKMAERLYKKNGRECVNLNDIYQIVAVTTVLDAKMLQRMETLECEQLIDTAIGIDMNINLAEKLIRSGEEVSFFADTIYGESVIKKILQKCSPCFEKSACFCSSELGKVQRTGSLFWKANQITGIKRADWVYYSASAENRKQAERVGMTLGEPEIMNSIGTTDWGIGNDYVFKVMESVSQAVLLECVNEKQRVGCRVGAPLLLQYVEWVLDCADKLNVSKLYFIARDGYILKKIADILIMERQLGIKTQYIYGSRKAWRIPSFSEGNCDIIELLKWSHVDKIKTYGAFADIFGLTVEELAEFLPLQYVWEEMPITRAALAYSIEKLKDSQEFKIYLIKKNTAARGLLKRYLKQEMGTEKEKFAFVELAGGGYTQECLANILQEMGLPQITNFYFKMDSVSQYNGCINYIFWPNAMKDTAIIETLCHSPEGQTLGYREWNGSVVPVLEENEGQALKEYGYEEYVNGIMLYIRKYIRYLKNFLRQGWSLALIDFYMDTMINNPDKELLLFIADMPFGVTGREKKVLKYAPTLTEPQIVEYYKRGIKADYSGMRWEYSLLRTQWEYPQLIEKYEKCEKEENVAILEEEYPVEFIRRDALLLCMDQFGESVYRTACERGKRITKLVQTADIAKHIDTKCQIVLAIKGREKLERFQAELEALGVKRERILAIDPQPKYILGK